MITQNIENSAPIFGISRLRMGTDGKGITTLVTFMGCPLKCKYCLNPKCHESIYEADVCTPRKGIQIVTPAQLYDIVKIDKIYFESTGGGICFGGGEPGLYWEFIKEFRKICGDKWKITIETSLSFDMNFFTKMNHEDLHLIDYWIIDIKSLDENIYKQYTGVQRSPILDISYIGKFIEAEKVLIKVPIISGYVNKSTAEQTRNKILAETIFTEVKIMKYIKKIPKNQKTD